MLKANEFMEDPIADVDPRAGAGKSRTHPPNGCGRKIFHGLVGGGDG